MEMEGIRGKILAVTIVVCSLWIGTASGTSYTYTFDPNQSTVVRSFLYSETYTLTGGFQLKIDPNTGTASFDSVNATFSNDPNFQTGDLGELFYTDELVGDVVNDTTIEFELPPGHPVRQSYDIHITLTFQNGHVRLTGQRFPLMVGEPGFTLEAIANLVKIAYVDTDAPPGGDGSSWATAFKYLQDALFNTLPGTEIRVAQGIYKPHLNSYSAQPPSRADTFQLKNGVAIRGGYAGFGEPGPDVRDIELYETVLSGDLVGNDIDVNDAWDVWQEPTFTENSYHVVTGSGTNSTAVLDGFTITSGCASGPVLGSYDSNDPLLSSGAGMLNDSGSPTVINCTFRKNTTWTWYGQIDGESGFDDGNPSLESTYIFLPETSGAAVFNRDGSPTFRNCIFEENVAFGPDASSAGAGVCNINSSPLLENCVFRANVVTGFDSEYYGGAMANYNSNPTLRDCSFIGNRADYSCGGAIYNDGGSPVLTNCAFTENLAVDGGAIFIGGDSSGTLTDCVFENNTADVHGGAISHTGFGELNIIHCEFRDGSAECGAAIYNIYASLVLSECILVSNQAEYSGAIYSDGDITLTNCLLANNHAQVWGGALANMENTSRSVNCTFVGNSANYGGAIFSNIECDTIAINSIFWGNTAQTGSQIATSGSHGSSTLTVSYCDIENGLEGLYVPDGCTLIWEEGNIDAEPYFVDPDGEDNVVGTEDDNLRLSLGSPCIDTGDNTAIPPSVLTDLDGNPRIVGDRVDMGAYEFQDMCILYVDANAPFGGDGKSWATAFRHLQDALFNAIPLTEIRIAQGIYKPDQGASVTPGDRQANFRIKARLTVKGGYAGFGEPNPNARDIKLHKTILSGDLNGDDGLNFENNDENSYHVVRGGASGDTTILDGFTITGGNANGFEFFHEQGGGIYVSPDLNFTIENCTIIRNRAESRGGGIHSPGPSYACLTITNCRFIANSAGWTGGGISLDGESLPDISNCLFAGNSAVTGGAIGIIEGYPGIINCTFTGNRASDECGGVIVLDGISHFENCILWGNTDAGGADESAQVMPVWGWSPPVNYSCIQGWTGALGGIGNIDADPCFVELGYWDANGTPADANDDVWIDGDYHLLPDSPCIGVGDNAAVLPSVLTDLDGNPRIVGNTVDMGAYEFSGLIYVDDDAPNDPVPGDPAVSDPLEDGTEPHPFDTIQEAIDLAVDGYTVLVQSGSYFFEPSTGNSIDFLGKNITLTSADPTDWDIVDNTIIRGYVQFSGNEEPNCTFTGFRIHDLQYGAIYGNHTHATISHCNMSGNGPCGATVIKDCDGIISNCLITDNTTVALCGIYPVVFGCNGLIKNCTIANNLSGVSVGTATIENCIIYNNFGSQLAVTNGETLNISYSNVQGGLEEVVGDGSVEWGPGNIDTDPCFVRLGYWGIDDLTLIEGDYHLKSEGWRWNTEGKSWTYDYITSRCIDAGNPGARLGGELMSVPRDPDNIWGVNLRINMGAYGGTGQASMPPHGWTLLADLNNDGTVNFLDFAHQTQDWLKTAPEQPGDLNRDGIVNRIDLAALAENWLQVTDWVE